MNEVFVAVHHACPFGGTASVHAWERVGALLCNIVRRKLRLVAFRYVDDFFGIERWVASGPCHCRSCVCVCGCLQAGYT